ncbi:TlpA disulfide reductase family protein [Marinifilum fragile]|uniref:TlpA family protein disulfide reductase n=1 Tax=Marinifilum fragile TaxID=570161 RepID=UPI002AAA9ECA|nr:TlpA disulfide reductase family protein [Marinifilum fragile]
MKFKITVLLILSFLTVFGTFAQQKKVIKPETIYIVDNEIVSPDFLKKLNPNHIKEMKMSVSGEEKEALVKKFGKTLEDNQIVVLVMKTEEEIKNTKATKTITPEEAAEMMRKNAEERAKKIKESTLINSGDMAKDFTLEMLDGSKLKLSDLKGKVVLINFWATWCAPCMKELYEFPERIIEPFADKDFVLLAISRGEEPDVVRKKMDKLKSRGVEFNAGLDPKEEIFKLYATNLIPRNFLVDQNGKVVYSSVGYSNEKLNELVKKIEELLK